jgi:glutamate formiminotransferase/formiminotetrahydrofolate cyclodeaminase
VDEDTNAFNRVMDCFRLPRKTDEQKRARDLAVAEANRGATRVPLSVLERVPELLERTAEVARIGNQNSLSDAGVGALVARGAAEGAYYNVLINLASLAELDQSEEPGFAAEARARAEQAFELSEQRAEKTRALVRDKLRDALGG